MPLDALLDTQSLIWAVLSPQRLSRSAADTISNPDNRIWVSAASAWEIATKVRIGKLPEAAVFEGRFLYAVTQVAGYFLREISVADGLRAGRLLGDHKDPFDRMIAAQALCDDIAVISNDTKMDLFGVRRIW